MTLKLNLLYYKLCTHLYPPILKHFQYITCNYFSQNYSQFLNLSLLPVFLYRVVLGVVSVGCIVSRIVSGHVTTQCAISDVMYKSFKKVRRIFNYISQKV